MAFISELSLLTKVKTRITKWSDDMPLYKQKNVKQI